MAHETTTVPRQLVATVITCLIITGCQISASEDEPRTEVRERKATQATKSSDQLPFDIQQQPFHQMQLSRGDSQKSVLDGWLMLATCLSPDCQIKGNKVILGNIQFLVWSPEEYEPATYLAKPKVESEWTLTSCLPQHMWTWFPDGNFNCLGPNFGNNTGDGDGNTNVGGGADSGGATQCDDPAPPPVDDGPQVPPKGDPVDGGGDMASLCPEQPNICTREYMPHVCYGKVQFLGDQSVAMEATGGNLCEAKYQLCHLAAAQAAISLTEISCIKL